MQFLPPPNMPPSLHFIEVIYAGPVISRHRFGSALGIFIALASLATACSSDGGASIDVEGELTADPLVVEYASGLSGASGTPPSLDPQSLGASIAAAIEDIVAAYDDRGDVVLRGDLPHDVGSVLGALVVKLSRLRCGSSTATTTSSRRS